MAHERNAGAHSSANLQYCLKTVWHADNVLKRSSFLCRKLVFIIIVWDLGAQKFSIYLGFRFGFGVWSRQGKRIVRRMPGCAKNSGACEILGRE